MKRILVAITLATVCESSSVRAQDRDVRTLVNDFSDALIKAGKKTAAVVDFTDLNGCVTELGRYLSEQISVSMAASGRGIEVVDRNHIKVLIQEHKLSASGIIDPATAQKLGQIAGVQVLVAGTLTPFGDSVQVTVKAMDSGTARIIAASTAEVAKTKAIEELLGRGVVGGCPSSPVETGGGTGDLSQSPAVATVQEKFSFEPVNCRFPRARATKGEPQPSLTCTVRVTNVAETTRGLWVSTDVGEATLIDESGSHYDAVSAQLGGMKAAARSAVHEDLPPNFPLNLVLRYEEAPHSIARARMLLTIRAGAGWVKVPISNIQAVP